MANIQPNTIIHLLKDVPLDNTYTDTLYWETANHQHDNLFSLRKYTFTQQTYQRVNKNRLRIQRCADDIYDCNYLMFQNTAFGNKWFYAFVTSVEYINNITSEIEYEIDDMQTWLFDYTLRPCFVEREHSATDNPDDLLLRLPEPIDIGNVQKYDTGSFLTMNYAILVSYVPFFVGGSPAQGLVPFGVTASVIGNNMVSGCCYYLFKMPDDILLFNVFLDVFTLADKEDNILGLTVVPMNFYNPEDKRSTVVIEKTFARPYNINGYVPRNKKLLNYPYTFLNVDTTTDSKSYRWEWFEDGLFSEGGHAVFNVASYICDNPQICVYPMGYNGTPQGQYNVAEKLTITGFPKLSWRSDGFISWLGETVRDTFVDGVNTGVNILSKDEKGTETSLKALIGDGVNAATDLLTLNYSSRIHGNSGSNVDISLDLRNIYCSECGVTVERAKQIDSFFDRYGYICQEIKVPNRNVREHYTYCQTRDCNIIGSIPVDSMKNIKRIYNKGITWWDAIGNVGDYTLSNRPTAELE